MRVYDATTSSLTVAWEHAEGPVQQYKITYAPTTGDPIEEHVSTHIADLSNEILIKHHQSCMWPKARLARSPYLSTV